MTTPVIRSNAYTACGAAFLNLGQPSTIVLVNNPARAFPVPDPAITVVATPTVVLRAAQ